MITLGTFDPDVPPAALDEYIEHANQMTETDWGKKLRGDGDWVEFGKLPDGEMKVAEVQRFLKEAGFLPFGKVDGICGYRTNSAIRLFQEYVRTVEGDESFGFPDGKFGPASARRVREWQEKGRKADWTNFSGARPSPECAKWMNLLAEVRKKYQASPDAMTSLVNHYSKNSDTVKVADWNFDPDRIHLVGIRSHEAPAAGQQKFNDAFVLLIHGLVFKFHGTTDPGATSNTAGYPFLVTGQHHYRFGWHKLSDSHKVYHALKPATVGVLVIRSKDLALTDADLAKGLECNNSINIHWGGEGLGAVGSWSEGCQVFVGRNYINHHEKLIDCSKFGAANYSTLGQRVGGVYQTRGAYTVLEDLVTAFSGDDKLVRYMLINEPDLALRPEIGANWLKDTLARFH